MNFTCTFDMDSAAFGEDDVYVANAEVAVILENIAQRTLLGDGEGHVIDTNGNTIGEWHINE